ncbi:hypothetical protein Celly_3120 [Sporocytophaga myxococcoides]|uniref:DUF998 domain-containing protein n=1 Tax=Sporocytophaga myxococcoides TaxID=153721 RepID=A0A098LBH5_9BACT|nr:hypothetical protein [Sporocytophaga myxococcoides]GAL84240.1 hypothetical protein Celly_3120 [Sporocytophaga myxococcoides]
MEETKSSKITTILKANFKEGDSIWLTSSYTLRKTVGVLGMALPLLLVVFLYIDNGYLQPLESLSHYYYTRVSGIFVATLSILGIFLIIYKGKELVDLLVSSIAGIAVLLVALFPTDNITDICCDITKTYSVTFLPHSTFREAFHYLSAGTFLSCLSYMSIFLFTKSDKSVIERGTMKIIRNRIYRICGIMIIIALAVIFLGGFFKLIPEGFYREHQITFWMETLAVESFGFSWLVKGETLFQDKT